MTHGSVRTSSAALPEPGFALGGAFVMDTFGPALGRFEQVRGTLDRYLPGTSDPAGPDEGLDAVDRIRCLILARGLAEGGCDRLVAGAATASFARAFAAAVSATGLRGKLYLGAWAGASAWQPSPGAAARAPGRDALEIDRLASAVFDFPEMFAVRDWAGEAYRTAFLPECLGAGPSPFPELGVEAASLALDTLYRRVSGVVAPVGQAWVLAAALHSEAAGGADLELTCGSSLSECRYLTVAGCYTAVLDVSARRLGLGLAVLPPDVVRGLREGRIRVRPGDEPDLVAVRGVRR